MELDSPTQLGPRPSLLRSTALYTQLAAKMRVSRKLLYRGKNCTMLHKGNRGSSSESLPWTHCSLGLENCSPLGWKTWVFRIQSCSFPKLWAQALLPLPKVFLGQETMFLPHTQASGKALYPPGSQHHNYEWNHAKCGKMGVTRDLTLNDKARVKRQVLMSYL